MNYGLPPEDPRSANKRRAELLRIFQGLVPPPNFRVVLGVDPDSGNLLLRILRREPRQYKIFGRTFWTHTPSWDDLACEQRRMVARTYEDLYLQLQAHPEFLEFEFAVEGVLHASTAIIA
jgi:hypothetical protein